MTKFSAILSFEVVVDCAHFTSTTTSLTKTLSFQTIPQHKPFTLQLRRLGKLNAILREVNPINYTNKRLPLSNCMEGC